MIENYAKALELIKKSSRIIVTAHQRPDGDACGSISALCYALADMGKEVMPIVVENYADWLDTLFEDFPPTKIDENQNQDISEKSPWKDADLFILTDSNHPDRAPGVEQFLKTGRPTIVFDHHNTAREFGDVRIVDVTAPATAQVLYKFFEYANIPVTYNIAKSLYAGLATDTGWFRYGSNLQDAYITASNLIKAGVDTKALFAMIYEQDSMAKIKLTARILESAKIHLDTAVIGKLRYEDFEETGAKGSDTEGLVNKLQAIEGIKVAMMLTERKRGQVKCSLRSEGKIIVRKIAETLGGGGHDLASGITLDCSLDEAEKLLLCELKKQI